MSSVCISGGCSVNDARVPVRASYINLYKWPESDAEFLRSVTSNVRMISSSSSSSRNIINSPRVVDSRSCRQIYLRSYTFSKKETVPEKTRKCLGRVKERVLVNPRRSSKRKNCSEFNGSTGRKITFNSNKCMVMRKVKEISSAALFSIFNRLLSCTASVEVVDRREL